MESNYTFKKKEHLKAKSDFQYVYTKGKVTADALSALYVLPGKKDERKIGFAVGKKLGSAVLRNHIKRLMREVYRKQKHLLKDSCYIVWVARRPATAAVYQTLEKSFLSLAKKAALFKKKEANYEPASDRNH